VFDPVDSYAEQIDEALKEPVFQFDPDFMRKILPFMWRMSRYFDAEVRGLERVPDGPVLLVGNHSGGFLTPDTTAFFDAWYRKFGLERPLVGLALDAAFAIPGFAKLMRRIGEIPATMANAGRALDAGAAVLVYPGGDYEVYRPWTERNRIEFNGHVGFIRLALAHGVPVVPVVGHGAHDSTIILTRGEDLARALRFDRVRMHIFPLLWQVPWGLSPMALMGIPLPAKVTLHVEEPLDWSRFRPEDADDVRVLKECYEEITGVMQARLTQLAEENPLPVWSRIRSLLPGGTVRSRRANRRAQKGTEMSEKKTQRKLTQRVREMVDSGADTAEEIHRAIAALPLDVLERIDALEGTVGDVRKVQDRAIGAVYGLVHDVNRDVTKLADAWMGAGGGTRRKATRKTRRAKKTAPKKATAAKTHAA